MAGADPPREPRILVLAFACMPGRGSESGTGWALARMAAGIGETWVITRGWPGSPAELERGLLSIPEGPRLHPMVVGMPFLSGSRPVGDDSRFERLEYVLWQLRALRTARRLVRRERIDLVWHASWSTAWLGSVGGLLGRPFVWGPIGGGVGIPWPVLGQLGRRGILAEIVRFVVQRTFRWVNPLVWLGSRQADLILAQNQDTARWLPASTRPRTEVFHHVALDAADERPDVRPDRPPTALFAGRLVAWKGAWLAIDAVAMLGGWRLIVVGAGADAERLRSRVIDRGLADRVTFLGRVERVEVLRMMREDADVFLFPSLHDEGGWVVGEAIAAGLPVVCIDRGGPPAIGGRGVPLQSAQATASRLAEAVQAAYGSPESLPRAPTIERRRAEIITLLRAHGLLDPIVSPAGPPTSADRRDSAVGV